MTQARLDTIYKISEDVVARKIDDKIVIVPIVSGIGSMDDDLYTLNATGQEIWELLNGENSISDIIKIIEKRYDAPAQQISEDVSELFADLLTKGIIVAI